jgi:hypothetical protein
VQADLTHRWCLDRRVVSASTLLCAATDGLFQAVCVVCVLRTQVVLPVSGVVLPTYGPAGMHAAGVAQCWFVCMCKDQQCTAYCIVCKLACHSY